jgi:hypothetical protein
MDDPLCFLSGAMVPVSSHGLTIRNTQASRSKRRFSTRRVIHVMNSVSGNDGIRQTDSDGDKSTKDPGGENFGGDDLSIDMVDGLIENEISRPMLDLDVDDSLMLQRLRMLMHKDDFNRIFDPKDRRIGDYL